MSNAPANLVFEIVGRRLGGLFLRQEMSAGVGNQLIAPNRHGSGRRSSNIVNSALPSKSSWRGSSRRASAWSEWNRRSAMLPEWSLAEVVTALQAMRGIDLIAAVTVLAEIGDLSRFQ